MAKSARRKAVAYAEFVFEVGPPSISYSFAVQHQKWREEPYDESQIIEFKATCLYPARFKGREVEVRLRGKRGLVQSVQQPRGERPDGVGSIVATKTKFELWAELPSDACWQVGAGMAAGAIRWMLANAPIFQPKHSFITSLSFYGPEFDALDYTG